MHRIILFFLIFITVSVHAAEFKPLEGTYAITAENYLDPAEDEPRDSHLRLELTGEAARDLYQSMKVDEETDACTEARMKSMGEMRCYYFKDDAQYKCDFSINLKDQKIEYGLAC